MAQTFQVTLRPEGAKDADEGIRRLRRFLKAALRLAGLRAVEVKEIKADEQEARHDET